MRTSPLPHYADAIAFALDRSTQPSRELYTTLLHVYVQQAPADRPQLEDKVYLEVYEKVPGGVIHLNWWAPATRSGVLEFFSELAGADIRRVSSRPYQLGQPCDGTIGSPVLHAYKVACDALGLDADALYRTAYTERGDNPPDWAECKRHAEWQGDVVWPDCWDEVAVEALAESLTEINYHSLCTAFTDAAEMALHR